MKIDWRKDDGVWQVWDQDGKLLAEGRQIVCYKPVELVTEGVKNHGWAVTTGEIEQQADRVVIR